MYIFFIKIENNEKVILKFSNRLTSKFLILSHQREAFSSSGLIIWFVCLRITSAPDLLMIYYLYYQLISNLVSTFSLV